MSSSEQLVEQLAQIGRNTSMSHPRKRGTSLPVPHPFPRLSLRPLARKGQISLKNFSDCNQDVTTDELSVLAGLANHCLKLLGHSILV